MERYWERCTESQFQKYLGTDDLCCQRPSKEDECAWLLCSPHFNTDSSLVPFAIKMKIKFLMRAIAHTSSWEFYSLVQFWAPKMNGDRCCLATSHEPYALGSLAEGLAVFRKQCVKHHYLVDEGAKEEELGPPGRVFQNGHPEISPDLCLYSITEFPLRDHAVHCRLRRYLAVPLFDLSQHQCVGVLEFLDFSDSALPFIGEALKAAKLRSAHVNFSPRFPLSRVPSNISEGLRLALTEVEETFQLVTATPQLYMAEVWIPYSECASTNSSQKCMELALSTNSRREFLWRMSEIHHVQARKGIIGMALASENESCFCRSSSGVSIADQPRAHFDQRERLDVCFAICLQSSHTGNLLYVLEFFLIQGATRYKHLRSFLSFLLPILKLRLKSFKVASGKQLGEELVVEVIEHSEANERPFFELNQPDTFPVKFKIVHYSQKEHQRTKDRQVRSMLASGSNSLLPCHMPIRNCIQKKNPSLLKIGTANESACDSQQDIYPSGGDMLLLSNMSLHQNAPKTLTESTKHLTVQPEAEKVTVRLKYGDDTYQKFMFSVSSGVAKIFEEVASRLKLKIGTFKLKYLDEDNDEVLLASDADLRICLRNLTAMGKNYIQLRAQLIHK